ncbi:MAG: efflux RND transporter periplasmic adaptor subunit, partial [Armatimonadetes bacterium]|nr:efflux RND transporter periplasmic adaptor subunit [Armatimonadota bacterium]
MKRWIFLIISLGVLGSLITWRIQTKRSEAAAAAEQRQARRNVAAVVSVAPAQVRDVVRAFAAVGTVEAPLNVKLSAEISGRILAIEGREGERVTRGQVLVRIDPSELEALVAQRRATLAAEKHRLAQARISQGPTDVSVASDVQQKDAELASAKARHHQALQNVEAQVGAAEASILEVQGRVESAAAAIANAEAAIRSAEANLENARAQFGRVSNLQKQGYVSIQDVDNSRTAMKVQEAAVDVARGQRLSAAAARDSALAQKQSAEKQLAVVRAKAEADVAAAEADVTRARAALDYARANTARAPAYQESLSALQSAVDAARASLANAQAQLSQTIIRCPVDGFVTARGADPGAVASPGQPILTVQAIRQVWVSVPVPEEVQRDIGIGHRGTVTFDALPGSTLTGTVTQINAAADAATRQFIVRLALDNPQGAIKPGMFARVSMVTGRVANAVVVPPEAVQKGRSGTTVTVVDEEQVAHERSVVVGESDAQGVAIREGLRPGEKVVVMAAGRVRDGQEVRVGGG